MKTKDKKRQDWLPFMVFLGGTLVYILAVLPFLVKKNGLFFYYGDYNVQQVPFLIFAHRAVREGRFFWNPLVDLGGNMGGCFAFYLWGSPFFWLTIPFPESCLPYLMPWLMALKSGTASLTAFLWIRTQTRTDRAAVTGALLYAFSGFQACNIVFQHFHDVTAFFPLYLLAFDSLVRFLRENSGDRKKAAEHCMAPFGFILMTALMSVINYYFFFGQVLFFILYYFIRWGGSGRKMEGADRNPTQFSEELSPSSKRSAVFQSCIRELIQIAAAGAAGLLLSSFFLLQAFQGIMGNSRVSKMISGYDLIAYPDSTTPLAILKSLFFAPDLIARGTVFTSENIRNGSLAFYLPCFAMAGVFAYWQIRKKDWKKKLSAVLCICAFVPVLGAAFSAFNSSFYARWYYMPVLLCACMTAEALEERERTAFVRGAVLSSACTLMFLLFCFLPVYEHGRWSFNSIGENRGLLASQIWCTLFCSAMLAVVAALKYRFPDLFGRRHRAVGRCGISIGSLKETAGLTGALSYKDLAGGEGALSGENLAGGEGALSGEDLAGVEGALSGEDLAGGEGALSGENLAGGEGALSGEDLAGVEGALSGENLAGVEGALSDKDLAGVEGALKREKMTALEDKGALRKENNSVSEKEERRTGLLKAEEQAAPQAPKKRFTHLPGVVVLLITAFCCVVTFQAVLHNGSSLISRTGFEKWKRQMLDGRPVFEENGTESADLSSAEAPEMSEAGLRNASAEESTDQSYPEGPQAAGDASSASASTFFRVETGGSSTNYEMVWGIPTMHCFESTIHPSIFTWYRGIGMIRTVESTLPFERIGARAVMSVRYYLQNVLVKSDEGYEDQGGISGYSFLKETNGFDVYETENFLPMGFCFDSFMTEKNYKRIKNGTISDRVLVKDLILSAETAEKYGGLMEEDEDTNPGEMPYREFVSHCEERKRSACTEFGFDRNGWHARAKMEKDNLLLFSIPYDEGFSVRVDGRPAKLERADFGLCAVFVPKGDHEIKADYLPKGLPLFAAVSLASAVILLAAAVIVRRRGARFLR